ncbi:MAG: sporulation integral membrane protein YtvI, partial [Clostridia bacterium]|nr:sporulation integral membrane protein YtvI [Clostridia bacterium]
MEKKSLEKLARPLLIIIYVAVGVLFFHLFVKYLFMWFLPFVIGFVVSRLAIPFCRWLKKKLKFKNGIASAVSAMLMMLALLAVIGAFGYGMSLWVIPYVKRVFTTLSGTMEQLVSTWTSLIVWLDDIFPADISKMIQDAISDMPKKFDLFGKVVSPVLSAAGSLPMIIFSVVVTPLSAFFFTKYDPEIVDILRSTLPEKVYEASHKVYHSLISKLGKWLKAQCILCGIDFALIFSGLLITGVNNALLIAVLIFLVDFLPVLGSGLVLIPWALIALLMGNYKVAIGVAIIYVVVLIVRNILESHVLGAQINMNPFVTLLSIFVGY